MLLFAEILHAQPYYFKHYQVENGLSNNSVFAGVQDDKGFMWFGTKDGLNRFDGYSFKTYRHDPADPTSLGNDKIYSLFSDKTVGLWVGTDLGLYKYNPEKETFSAVKETLHIGIRSIHADKKGNLWLLSNSKPYRYNPTKNEFSAIKIEDSFEVGSIYCHSNGEVLITSPDGRIAIYNPQSRSFQTRYQMNKKGAVNIGWIPVFTETKDQQLLLGSSSQGIKLFNPKTNELKDIITQNKDKTHIYVRDMQARNEDEFWIGTESGLYIYNHKNGSISHQQKNTATHIQFQTMPFIQSLKTEMEACGWVPILAEQTITPLLLPSSANTSRSSSQTPLAEAMSVKSVKTKTVISGLGPRMPV